MHTCTTACSSLGHAFQRSRGVADTNAGRCLCRPSSGSRNSIRAANIIFFSLVVALLHQPPFAPLPGALYCMYQQAGASARSLFSLSCPCAAQCTYDHQWKPSLEGHPSRSHNNPRRIAEAQLHVDIGMKEIRENNEEEAGSIRRFDAMHLPILPPMHLQLFPSRCVRAGRSACPLRIAAFDTESASCPELHGIKLE